MSVIPGEGAFSYAKRACMLSSSFVSSSQSPSGWGYETTNEIDGFLVTIPGAGDVVWSNESGMHLVRKGEATVVDQRCVTSAAYAPRMTCKTVYISNADMLRVLTIILGKPPKQRMNFAQYNALPAQVKFIQDLIETILQLSDLPSAQAIRIMPSLLESLISAVVFSFKNNYSSLIYNVSSAPLPTPHCIKLAAEYMYQNQDPHLTVGEVAAYAGISVRSLQTGFKRYKDTTPILFLREIRLQNACMRLAEFIPPSIPEIALVCGFSNYQVFCKYYLQRFGEHPKITVQKAAQRRVL